MSFFYLVLVYSYSGFVSVQTGLSFLYPVLVYSYYLCLRSDWYVFLLSRAGILLFPLSPFRLVCLSFTPCCYIAIPSVSVQTGMFLLPRARILLLPLCLRSDWYVFLLPRAGIFLFPLSPFRLVCLFFFLPRAGIFLFPLSPFRLVCLSSTSSWYIPVPTCLSSDWCAFSFFFFLFFFLPRAGIFLFPLSLFRLVCLSFTPCWYIPVPTLFLFCTSCITTKKQFSFPVLSCNSFHLDICQFKAGRAALITFRFHKCFGKRGKSTEDWFCVCVCGLKTQTIFVVANLSRNCMFW